MAACDDQSFTVTSSSNAFPGEEDFNHRETFCIIVRWVKRSANIFSTNYLPGSCHWSLVRIRHWNSPWRSDTLTCVARWGPWQRPGAARATPGPRPGSGRTRRGSTGSRRPSSSTCGRTRLWSTSSSSSPTASWSSRTDTSHGNGLLWWSQGFMKNCLPFRSNFIANMGGILGLCLGASMISIIEVVWYCLLLCYSVFKYWMNSLFILLCRHHKFSYAE